ncbi:MAG TPA: signal peptidase II [Tissierellaceae bacterium]|nr:signal peptidase II [Tissierellaceae bacterium]
MVLILSLAIIILDQVSKHLAIKYLKNKKPYVIVENFFQLSYVENRGAAFGILQHKRSLFIIFTIIIILILSLYLFRNYNLLNKFTKLAFALLIGGAIGNLIDRIRFGYVVDFISFRLFNRYDFPVFNVADISIVASTFIIIYLVLFDQIEI